MNYTSIGLGLVLVAFGVITFVLRIKNPAQFRKLEAMKKFFGARTGGVLHFVFYTLIPVIYGVVSILLGIQGRSFF